MVQPLLGGKPSGTDFSAQFRWQAHAVNLRKVRMQRSKDSAGWVNWERGRWWFLRIVVTMRFVVHPVCAGHLEPALNQCRWCHLHTYHWKFVTRHCSMSHQVQIFALSGDIGGVGDIGQCHTNCPAHRVFLAKKTSSMRRRILATIIELFLGSSKSNQTVITGQSVSV